MTGSGLTHRNYMYRLLSNFYACELTLENMESIRSGKTAKLMDALQEIEPYASMIVRLKERFGGITDLKQTVLDLSESYAWLFHGVAGPLAAPLTSSVYLSRHGAEFQEPEADFNKLLQKHGLSFKRHANEPCDHLSVILEFVAWLSEQAESAENPYPWMEEQRLVIEKHLLSWLPAFAARCRQGDGLGFYAGLAEDTWPLSLKTPDNCRRFVQLARSHPEVNIGDKKKDQDTHSGNADSRRCYSLRRTKPLVPEQHGVLSVLS